MICPLVIGYQWEKSIITVRNSGEFDAPDVAKRE
jgi:hypothetical protein